MIIIDDAYNSNIEGAVNALAVLAEFDDKYKVIVTPGLVELGGEETEMNFRLGAEAGKSATASFLLGLWRRCCATGPYRQEWDGDSVFCTDDLYAGVPSYANCPGKRRCCLKTICPTIIRRRR